MENTQRLDQGSLSFWIERARKLCSFLEANHDIKCAIRNCHFFRRLCCEIFLGRFEKKTIKLFTQCYLLYCRNNRIRDNTIKIVKYTSRDGCVTGPRMWPGCSSGSNMTRERYFADPITKLVAGISFIVFKRKVCQRKYVFSIVTNGGCSSRWNCMDFENNFHGKLPAPEF